MVKRKILHIIALSLGLTLFTACGGGGSNSTTDTTTPITHNGTTYGTVTSPFTGKVWLDRNLGAARVCESFDDVACYGDYYQWGRNFDGHQDSMSGITIVQITSINGGRESSISDFIIKSEDWVSIGNSTGSLRAQNWQKIDGSSVCPVSFRVPTLAEFQAELLGTGANIQNKNDAFSVFLKLPTSGIRKFSSGALVDGGGQGHVWASSPNGSRSGNVFFDSNNAVLLSELRSQGLSVRCIKN